MEKTLTTKGLKYQKFTCDICDRTEKKEIEEDYLGNYLSTNVHSYSISGTWVSIDNCQPINKPDPEKIEMCDYCAAEFKLWRLKRKQDANK